MKLSVSDIQKLSSFYRESTLILPKPGSRLQNWFEENFDIRTAKGNIKMTAKIKQQARQELQRELGFDILEGVAENLNRMAMSASALDEKLAAIKPDASYVLVSSPQKQIFLLSDTLTIPDGMSLRIPIQQLNVCRYRQVVIVENLDVFDALPGFSLPVEGDTLLVYRGHEKSIAKGVKALIRAVKGRVPVYWFGDLDPKGVELAFASDGIEYVISADISEDVSQLQALSRMEKWQQQHKSLAWCKQSAHQRQPLVQAVVKHHLAVMQQHLLTRNIKLAVYKVNIDSMSN